MCNNKFDKKTRQPEEKLDEDKFLVEYCKAVIKGWSGLKISLPRRASFGGCRRLKSR